MKRWFLGSLTLLFVLLTGCGMNGKNINSELESKIMNVPMSEVSSIEKYSKGEVTTILNSSEEVLNLMKAIEDNEDFSGVIDGGLDMDMLEHNSEGYADFSKQENCTLYLFNFSEYQEVKYAEYESKNNIIAVFIVPEKGYFGTVTKSEDSNEAGYATLMNVEKNIFE